MKIETRNTFFRLLLLFSIATTPQCHKAEEEPPKPTIEGQWTTLIPASKPHWQYDFHAGLLRQWCEVAGVTVSDATYPYAMRSDTAIIGGDGYNPTRRWIVRFIGDGAMDVRQLPVTEPGIAARMILERKH